MNRETIFIDDSDCLWVRVGLWKYKGQYLSFVERRSDGSDEMVYCDENGNILSGSPRVISIPGSKQTDARCIIRID